MHQQAEHIGQIVSRVGNERHGIAGDAEDRFGNNEGGIEGDADRKRGAESRGRMHVTARPMCSMVLRAMVGPGMVIAYSRLVRMGHRMSKLGDFFDMGISLRHGIEADITRAMTPSSTESNWGSGHG